MCLKKKKKLQKFIEISVSCITGISTAEQCMLFISVSSGWNSSTQWLPHDCRHWVVICVVCVCVCVISVYRERRRWWRLQPESGEQMDRQHRGALPQTAGQTGQTIQIHRYVLGCVIFVWNHSDFSSVGAEFQYVRIRCRCVSIREVKY